MSWCKLKTVLNCFLPLTLLAALILAVLYRNEVGQIQNDLQKNAINLVSLQKKRIGDKTNLISTDILYFANHRHIQDMFASPAASRQEAANDLALFSRVSRNYDQIRVLSSAGMEMVRINQVEHGAVIVPQNQLQNKAERYYFKEAYSLPKGALYISPIDLNVEHGLIEQPFKPMIRIATPVFDRVGRKQGIIIFNHLATNILREFKDLAAGSVGQSMLLNRDGYWLVGRTADEEWGFMSAAGKQRNMEHSYPEAWRTISGVDEGQLLTKMGLFTFATVSNSKSSTDDWKIVSFIPVESLQAVKNPVWNRYVIIFLLVLVFLAFVSWLAVFREFLIRQKEAELLRQSEQYNRLLFELSPIGLALCRMDGGLVDINPAYAGIIGRSVKETVQLSYWDITPVKYQEQELEHLKSLEETGQYGPYEKEYIHKDGRLIPVRLQGQVMEQNGEKYIWSSVEDISESKQIEQELRRNEEVLLIFVEHSPASIAMFDREMKYIAASHRFLSDYGLGNQNVVGLSHYEVFPDVPEEWREIHRRCLAGAIEKAEEDPFPRSDGKIDWVRWEIRPWYEAEGEVGGIILFSEVITKRKMAEDALRNSEEKFLKAFHATPDAIVISRLSDGLIFEFNEVFLQQTGFSPEEVRNRSTVDLHLWASESDRERYVKGIREQGKVREMEAIFRAKSGEILIGLVSGESIELNGQPSLLTIIRNITDRKVAELELEKHRDHLEELVKERTENLEQKTHQLERSQQAMQYLLEDINVANKQLGQANDKLMEVDRLKSMFIASMSHELRTPLNSVIGFSSILLNEWVGPLNDEQKKNQASILRSGKHLLSLINDVIDVSKIEAGMIEVSREDFELDELLAEVEQIFAKEARDRKLSLSIQSLNLPMHTDRRRLLQCILNLVSNGIKYTEQGGVAVAVRLDEKQGTVAIAVTDTGIGIGGEDQAKLFQAFSRIQSHLSATVLGTGLGLYLTRKIAVDILHGHLTVTSELGNGSCFTMVIPTRVGDDRDKPGISG